MTELQKVFEYQGVPVRTVVKDGEVWFVAKDVCEILEHSNPSKAVKDLVDEDDLTTGYPIVDSIGRTQHATLVNEPGLYSLILGSRKPEAKQFKRWVTHEVLPSIRRTGKYTLPSAEEFAEEHPARLLLSGRTWGQKYSAMQIHRETGELFISPEEVARRCGIYTAQEFAAKPHGEFIRHLVMAQFIEISEDEIGFKPLQFRESVVPKVAEWMRNHDCPTEITFGRMTHRIQFFPPKAERGYYKAGEYDPWL